MGPFTLGAVSKDYLWGGTRLQGWGKGERLGRVAESWELAALPEGDCVAQDGACGGMTLSQIVRAHPRAVSSSHCAEAPFPLLVKLLDTALPLSVQVHPDDAYAARIEGGLGKTEMWYILDHEPGAFLHLGLRDPISRAGLERAIREDTLLGLLRRVEVHRGDCLLVPPGTLHSIGGGILLAEIQQSSNLTYRVFDFHRLGPDGRPRQLHVEKALDVARLEPLDTTPPGALPPAIVPGGSLEVLAACPQFQVKVLRLNGRWEGEQGDDFLSLFCLDGRAALRSGSQVLEARRGTSLFLPADMGPFSLEGEGEFLLSSSLAALSASAPQKTSRQSSSSKHE